MWSALVAALCGLAVTAPARAEGLRRTVAPMTRADGEICDLLRSEAHDRCAPVTKGDAGTVYQSGGKRSGIRRVVLAIQAGAEVLVSPAIDVASDRLASTAATVRAMAIDGRPGIVAEVVSTWRRGERLERTLVGCARGERAWRCAVVEVGACDATVAADATVTTSCGATSTLAP